MLVLSRKETEAIRIDDDIRIVIVRCGKGRVRVAIEAPAKVQIEREELWIRRQELIGMSDDETATICNVVSPTES